MQHEGPVVVVSGVVMWGTPAGVIQALCEQGVMSITQPTASGSRRCHALQLEQIGKQDDRLAIRTTTSKSDRACVHIAVSATALTEDTLATPRTLVHSMRDQQPPTLELLA
jgi:hypothetical protein